MKKFELKRNTFIKSVSDDKRASIECEVGDSKQDDFFPQFKVKKWDNRCNVSVRYTGKGGTFGEKNERIVWKKGKEEAHFYDIDNGFEFEIKYLEKPKSNVTEFTLQTKGVRFFYQGELTEEEKSKGRFRDENVIGSYAIYTDKRNRNYENGLSWKTGKVGHIYRPKSIDANGREVWCKLHIDEEKGTLSVTTPQEFLDTAVYPVIVDPTFGYESVGGSSIQISGFYGAFANTIRGLGGATGDVITQYHFYARKESANNTIYLNTYRVSGGYPTTKLSTDQGVMVNSSTPQWWNSSTISVAVSVGEDYCLAYGGWGGDLADGQTRIYYDSADGYELSENSSTSLTSSWNEVDSYTNVVSLYATYTRLPVSVNYSYKIFIDKANLQ